MKPRRVILTAASACLVALALLTAWFETYSATSQEKITTIDCRATSYSSTNGGSTTTVSSSSFYTTTNAGGPPGSVFTSVSSRGVGCEGSACWTVLTCTYVS